MRKTPIKKRFLRLALITGIILLVFVVYVEIVNRNSVNMTYRQKVLKAIYPAWMWWSNLWNNKNVTVTQQKKPVVSFFDLSASTIDGKAFSFSELQGKKIMVVNTASDCGFTGQYADLQKLYEKEKDRLEIIAFPSNEFKGQEPGSNEEIAAFCSKNFGVQFPLMEKTGVRRGAEQHPVYQWLTDSEKNGWNSREPEWNFSKYIIDENGTLTHYFGAAVSPLDEVVMEAIKN